MGKIIKTLAEDYAKTKPAVIANWKELDKYAEIPIKDMCVDLYKKIYLLVTLIQTSIVSMEDEE